MLNKKQSVLIILIGLFLLSAVNVFAGDDRSSSSRAPISINAMPPLEPREYGRDTDNENNDGTGTPDWDMDTCVFNDYSNHPIEFNIIIPNTVTNPQDRAATLRMNIWDVDLPDEIDEVFLNGVYLGTLTGANNTWGINIFNIPIGTLKNGKNLVQIKVDRNYVGYWCVEVDWGIIKLSSATEVNITRAWITPNSVKLDGWINVFAEISGMPAKVEVYNGTTYLFDLSDPDGDNIWSGQYQIPNTWTTGYKRDIRILAKNSLGKVLSRWPGLTVLP